MNKILISAIFIAFSLPAFGQSLSVFDVNPAGFPNMEAKFFALGTDWNQLTNLSPSDFTVVEDGMQQSVYDVSCPAPKPPTALSSVLTIDISGSMSHGGLDNAKAAARAWINALPLGKSECAISTFNHANYFNLDFTFDRDRLLQAVNELSPSGGTNFDAGFINQMAGALLVAERGRFKKVVVFLTDGAATGNTDEIVQKANSIDAIVYCVTLGMPTPKILRQVAERTGGKWFENVTTQEEAESIYRKILIEVQGSEPCTIKWESSGCETRRTAEISIPSLSVASNLSYYIPLSYLPHLEYSPIASIKFGKVKPDTTVEKEIKLTARVFQIDIQSITPSDNRFSIIDYGGPAPPFSLGKDQSRTITIGFTPIDSGYVFSRFNIESNSCLQDFFYASGGFPGYSSIQPTIKVTVPDGGETLLIGSDTLIAWEGIMPEDKVAIDYSTNNGIDWIRIPDYGTYPDGLEYEWCVPKTPSDQCLMRIKQVEELWSIIKSGHGAPVLCTNWSPDGTMIATGGMDSWPNRDARVWDSQTGQQIKLLGGQRNNVKDIEWSPDGTRIAAGTGGQSDKLNRSLIIWDFETGDILVGIGHPYAVSRLSWSPDGAKIACVGGDSSIVVYDALNGVVLTHLKIPYVVANSVDWSPDGAYIAAGTIYGLLVWNASTYELDTLYEGSYSEICWSPDGSMLATVSDYTISIYEIETGALFRAFGGTYGEGRFIDWTADGTRLATCDIHKVRVWELSSVEVVASFTNEGSIHQIRWNPAGTKIAIASHDWNLYIWFIENVIQKDISDARWTIAMPQAQAADIDFGRVLTGELKDSTFIGYLMNTGSFPVRIDDISIQGANASEFAFVSPLPPFTIETGQNRSLEFRFSPSSAGVKTANIIIRTQSDTISYSIRGEGIEPFIETVNVDFTKVKIGNTKTIDNVIIRNTGTAPIEITNTELIGPDKEQFSINSGGGAFSLAVGEEKQMAVEFAPENMGRTGSQIAFRYNGVGSPAISHLNGEGTDLQGKATLAIGTFSGKTGEIVNLPIILKDQENLTQSGAYEFETEIAFNATLLVPEEGTPIGAVGNGLRFIRLCIPATADGDGVLASFPFKATLGNVESTSIEMILSNTYAVGGDVEIEVEPGLFTIINICKEGGNDRLVKNSGTFILNEIAPNPVSSKLLIEYEIIEKCRTELHILDLFGRKVKTIFNEYKLPDKYSQEIDISDLPDGVYFITLKSLNNFVIKRLQIVK